MGRTRRGQRDNVIDDDGFITLERTMLRRKHQYKHQPFWRQELPIITLRPRVEFDLVHGILILPSEHGTHANRSIALQRETAQTRMKNTQVVCMQEEECTNILRTDGHKFVAQKATL